MFRQTKINSGFGVRRFVAGLLSLTLGLVSSSQIQSSLKFYRLRQLKFPADRSFTCPVPVGINTIFASKMSATSLSIPTLLQTKSSAMILMLWVNYWSTETTTGLLTAVIIRFRVIKLS